MEFQNGGSRNSDTSWASSTNSKPRRSTASTACAEQLQDAASDDGAATEDAIMTAPARPNNSVRAIRFRWSEPDRRGLLAAGLPSPTDRNRGRHWHVFSALNFRPNTQRDMQDTFFIEKNPDIRCARTPRRFRCAPWAPEAAHPRHLAGRVFLHEAISCRALHLPPDRRTLHRRRSLVRRHEAVASLLRQGGLRRTDRHPHASCFPSPSLRPVDVSVQHSAAVGLSQSAGTGWLEIMGAA